MSAFLSDRPGYARPAMMSYVSEPVARHPQPRDFTSGQLKALEIVRDFRLRRVKGGWQAPGSPKVLLSTAQYLGFKRLVERRDYHGVPRLEITAAGRTLLELAQQRSRR